ncbi:FliC/FljB family flagellin [Chromohalobacter israelensis]
MAVINTNITAMIGQQNLNESKSALTTSMERLSSGLRINSAKDDAAGQAIANRMTAQTTGLAQAQRNANDGISVAQTAEGALDQVNDNLQRVRELTVQAQNGTNSSEDLSSIQDEIGQRLNEIDRISKETDFNGVKVLANDQALSIQVGANDNEIISINLEEITSSTLKLNDFTVEGDKKATEAQLKQNFGAELTGAEFTDGTDTYSVDSDGNVTDNSDAAVYASDDGSFTTTQARTAATAPSDSGSGDWTETVAYSSGNTDGKFTLEVDGETYTATVDKDNQSVTYEDSNGDAFSGNFYKTDGGNFTTTENREAATTADLESSSEFTGSKSYKVAEGSAAGDYTVASNGTITNDSDEAMYLSKSEDGTSSLVTEANAEKATNNPLEALDSALGQVDSLRSDLGAVQNRFESAITNLSTNETNLTAARSRIEDADYATEVANMTKNQILQQAGTSVLAQANQLPQSVLSLLG